MSQNIIEIKNVSKTYGDNTVLNNLSLNIRKNEFLTLLGPSGCGKTTTLKILAGFENSDIGKVLFNDEDISALPPYKRQLNTVFQKYALFPHLNIYDNISFGLKEKKVPKDEIEKKVKRVLEIVDLEGFEKRKIDSLYGGQKQRIAIARAIVNEPKILLLDEPLSALDYKMRQEMQIELKNMHKELGITFIFVTHDQEEALMMSDKIVVMSKGQIQQVGTPEEIYNKPQNAFVADFIGESNIFDGVKKEGNLIHFAHHEEDCEIILLNVERLLVSCQSACVHHQKLIRNLVSVLANKTLILNDKITHVGKRTTRDKLLSYLSSESIRQSSLSFDIPFDRQQLADYLCIDRAAMSVELSKLQKEGLIKTNRKHFELTVSIDTD